MDYKTWLNEHKNQLFNLLLIVLVIGVYIVTGQRVSNVEGDVEQMYSPLAPYLPDEWQATIGDLLARWDDIEPTVVNIEDWYADLQDQNDDTSVTYGYQTSVYLTNGGDKQVIASGGEVEYQSGSTLDVQSGTTTSYGGTLDVDGAVTFNSTLDVDGNITSGTGAVTITDNVLIDGAADAEQLVVQGNATQTSSTLVVEQSDGTDVFTVSNVGDVLMAGTTPFLTIGDAGEEDAGVVIDGNAQDFYIALDDTADDLLIGLGSAVGTTGIVFLDENQDTGLGGASAGAKLDVTGNVVIDGAADEEQLVVQCNGTQTSNAFVVEDATAYDLFRITGAGDVLISGTTPLVTIGDADEEDTTILFDGNAQDYYLALDDTADDLLIGLGNAVGTTGVIYVDENQDTGLGGASAGAKLDVTGNVLVDGAADEVQLTVQSNGTQTTNPFVVEDSAETDMFTVAGTGDVGIAGTTPLLTIGDTDEEDAGVLFDGNAQDFYVALDDTADDLVMGLGSAIGTTGIVFLDENQDVGIGSASAGAKLAVTGNALVDGAADEVQMTIQGNSTQTSEALVVEDSGGTDVHAFKVAPAAIAGGFNLFAMVDTLPAMDGGDTVYGQSIALTGGGATGTTNTVAGLHLGYTTPDAQATEVGLLVNDADFDYAVDAGAVPIWSSAQILFEDFMGDTIAAEHIGLVGTDPQCVAPTLAQEQYGVVQLVSGDDNTNCAASCTQLAWGLHWQADQGSLMFEARLHIDTAVTNAVLCVGLTDNAALEMPATIGGGDAITTNADDMVAFCFDDAADTDEWFAIGSAGGTDATGNGATGVAPTADVYQVLRIEVDAAGAESRFYIDGTLVKTLTANSVTVTDPLTPVVVVDTNAAASNTIDVDYFGVVAQRQ